MSDPIQKTSRSKAIAVLAKQHDSMEAELQVMMGRCLHAAGKGTLVPRELLDELDRLMRHEGLLGLLHGTVETFVEPIAHAVLEDDIG